jgi:hypothetical protein
VHIFAPSVLQIDAFASYYYKLMPIFLLLFFVQRINSTSSTFLVHACCSFNSRQLPSVAVKISDWLVQFDSRNVPIETIWRTCRTYNTVISKKEDVFGVG